MAFLETNKGSSSFTVDGRFDVPAIFLRFSARKRAHHNTTNKKYQVRTYCTLDLVLSTHLDLGGGAAAMPLLKHLLHLNTSQTRKKEAHKKKVHPPFRRHSYERVRALGAAFKNSKFKFCNFSRKNPTKLRQTCQWGLWQTQQIIGSWNERCSRHSRDHVTPPPETRPPSRGTTFAQGVSAGTASCIARLHLPREQHVRVQAPCAPAK